MANKDLYGILGVDRNASEEEIKKAYKKLAIKYHPDRHTNDSENDKKIAEEKFKEISEAYSILSDSEKKQQYDMYGTVGDDFSSGGMNPEDIMAEFMRSHGFGHSNFGGGGNVYRQGADKKIRISVTLEDVFFERFKEVNYEVERPCDECSGRGSKNGKDVRCPYCGGTGVITEMKRWAGGMMQSSHPCPHCQGTGYYVEDPCTSCGGTGVKMETVSRGFKIPKIDKLAYTYKMEGEGHSCHNNRGSNGDLYFTYTIKEDPSSNFHLDETNPSNIITEINVSVFDCLIGCDKEIKTIDGKTLKVKIPKGTKDGTCFNFIGYGFKCSNGMVGKLIVKVKMEMPLLNEEQINKIKEVKLSI